MKKKTLQKFSRLFASLVLVGAMSLGTVATVDAKTPLENGAYTYEEEEAAKAAITVVYKMGKDATTPANIVNFTFTKVSGPNGGTNYMPELKVNPIVFGAGANEILDTTESEKKVLRKQTDDFLQQFYTYMKGAGKANMAVGTYEYKLTSESTGSNSVSAPSTFKESQAEYTLDIYVAQKTSDGSLYIKGTGFRLTTKDDGTAGDGSKVDATPGTSQTTGSAAEFSKLTFVNEYTQVIGSDTPNPATPSSYALKVSNTAEDAKDPNVKFDYKMTLTAPTDLNGVATKYTYQIFTGTSKTSEGEGTYGEELPFSLKSGQSLMVTKGYVGTKVNVEQKGQANWTPSVEYAFGVSTATKDTAKMGSNLKVSDKYLKTSPNKVDYINTYKDIAVTGIIVNNFPFVMMIVMAMAAFVAIVAVKSRRRMNER